MAPKTTKNGTQVSATSCHAQADTVRNAVGSTSTCSSSTVTAVQLLLSLEPKTISSKEADKENGRVKNATKAAVAKAAAKARAPASSTIAKGKTMAASEDTKPTLSAKEKFLLATEVFNASLKALSAALKPQPKLQHRSSFQKLAPRSPRHANKGAVRSVSSPTPSRTLGRTASQRPLIERSASQVSNIRVQRRSSSYSSCNGANTPGLGVVSTAECCQLALAYLRTPAAEKVAGKDLPPLQVENGMLALVGKLMALGLESQAVRELRILRRRLGAHMGCIDTPKEKETLATLLRFDSVDVKSKALPLILSYQSYVLKIIVSSKRVPVIEAALEFLELSHPSAPANLILATAKSSDATSKAAKQLEALSQTLLSLCPGVGSVDDKLSMDSKASISPESALKLQVLAFNIKRQWWKLASHEPEIERELLSPLSKCISAFARRSNSPPKEKFEAALSAWSSLKDIFSTKSQGNSKLASPSLVDAYITIASLAQATELFDEALDWVEKALSISKQCSISESRQARLNVKIAAIRLEKSQSKDAQIEIQAALSSMEGSLKGSSADLSMLLNEVVALRKTAMRSLVASKETIDCGNKQHYGAIVSIVSSSIRFLSRYIGTAPSEDSDPEAFIKYGERLQIAKKVVKGFLDSGISCCKLLIDSRNISWGSLDRILRDGSHIVQELQPDGEGTDDFFNFNQQLQFPAIKISNLYWMYYLKLSKDDAPQHDILLRCLRRAAECLKAQSPTEKETGLLPIKLERLGAVYESGCHFKEALGAYSEAARTLIEIGVLAAAAGSATTMMLEAICSTYPAMYQLGKILTRFYQLQAKRKYKDDVFQESIYANLSRDEQGLLLEMQLSAISTTFEQRSPGAEIQIDQIKTVSNRLLEVYTIDQYPLRRKSIAIVILKSASSNGDQILQDIVNTCLACSGSSYASLFQDSGLQLFESYLNGMLDCITAFRMEPVSIEKLQSSLTIWQTIIDGCSDYDSLTARIPSLEQWQSQMQVVLEYMDMQGLSAMHIPTLRLLERVSELRASGTGLISIRSTVTSALQYLRCGYIEHAKELFDKAQKILDNDGVPWTEKLQWHLGYAELLLEIGNSKESLEFLEVAESIAHKHDALIQSDRPTATVSERLQANRLVAEACYIRSLVALDMGDVSTALSEGRRCTKLYYRVWMTLESKYTSRKSKAPDSTDSEMDAVTTGMANLCGSAPEQPSPMAVMTQQSSLSGAPFWSLVPNLFRAFTHMSEVFAYLGQLQDAAYFADQAQKIVAAVGSKPLRVSNHSAMAELWTRGGRVDKAAECLAEARTVADTLDLSIEKALYHRASAALFQAQGEEDNEIASLDQASAILTQLVSEQYMHRLDQIQTEEDALTLRMAAVKITAAAPLTKAPRTLKSRGPAAKTTSKVISKKVATKTPKAIAPSPPFSSLGEYRSDLLRRRGFVCLLQNDLKQAEELFLEAGQLTSRQRVSLEQRFAEFRQVFHQAMHQLTTDLTFNVLPESTIAFPCLGRLDRRTSEQSGRKSNYLSPVQKNSFRSPSPKKNGRSKASAKLDFSTSLSKAYENMSHMKEMLQHTGSLSMIQQVFRAMSSTSVLLSATISSGALHPLQSAYLSSVPQSHALLLEHSSISAERRDFSRSELLKWPTTRASFPTPHQLTAARFQRDFVDIIPATWTAVSLSLNATQDEIYVTRYRAHESPFILRLPMSRHRSDLDEEAFDFAAGKAELAEIINLSNFSTHATTDMSVKGAKTEWWAEREALDSRLRELLVNIENIWFGGFSGIFSQHQREPDLLARFQNSLHGILDRHLPSRQGRKKAKALSFDTRVLELFIGLGDATNEELELDEALMDLLYFIVDILQFNGERNAYDEIDFDTMALETIDALRSYHGSLQPFVEHSKQHTILILDPDLHAFPWESMPSLTHNSISRLPSLAALRERIVAAQSVQSGDQSKPTSDLRFTIQRDQGGISILNPGGDLKNTATTITPYLSSLPHQDTWSHHTTVPSTPKDSESLFTSALISKPLCLYFGHGSGAQYIRPRSIRRLESCATTWLMGCSSSAVDTHGEFLPSGMVLSYLTAGAPAVVGSLWDVTDKDCDRFAVKCGEHWGLWEKRDELPVDGGGKGKGKVKKRVLEVEKRGTKTPAKGKRLFEKMEQKVETGVSLVEAVTKARDACYLRYLNGAAMVCYGIPVYLN